MLTLNPIAQISLNNNKKYNLKCFKKNRNHLNNNNKDNLLKEMTKESKNNQDKKERKKVKKMWLKNIKEKNLNLGYNNYKQLLRSTN